MGFNTVYKYLTDIFPQIDSRLLKAVAIEHSKDADAAANVVLTEILPYWEKQACAVDQSASSSSSKDPSPRGGPSDNNERAEHEEQSTLCKQVVARRKNKILSSFLEPRFMTSVYTANTDTARDLNHDSDSPSLNKALNESTVSHLNDANGGSSQLFGNAENEEVILLGKTQEIGVEIGSNKVFTAVPDELMDYEGGNTDFSQVCANIESKDSESSDKGQYVTAMPDELMDYEGRNTDFSEVCANSESNVKDDQFSEVCANTESNDSVLLNKSQGVNVKVDHISQVCPNTESNDLFSLDEGQNINDKVGPEQTPFSTSTWLVNVNGAADGSLTDWKDFGGSGDSVIDTSDRGKSNLVESCLDCPHEMVESFVPQVVPSSVKERTSDVPECDLQSELGSGTPSTDCGKPDLNGYYDWTCKQENSMSEKGYIEDESIINTVVTRSGQVCRIDLLEEMIQDAKNNKKTLFFAMESVMNMLKEVEVREKAAEEAKQEAEKGGLDILVKLEELKLTVAHAKEANDMHAGEIYGEKAILATEAKELQNRLLGLSEERDKSLAILEEMHKALEARLDAAEEMRKAAEQEKLEKEESARNSLPEQEAIMEKVVQESKILQKQAEENFKLQEFLMDRGRVVDSLQGEISVICQDVRLLKEKFDEHVPLSKSVSSSQTTCILASSGSSMKSMASLFTGQDLTFDTPKKSSPTPSVDVHSPKCKLEDGRIWDDLKELSDDGWDFFDKDTELNSKAL